MDFSALTAISPASSASHVADMAGSSAVRKFSAQALKDASPEEQRKQVARQFEAIIVRQLLGPTMTKMLGKDNDTASSVFGDLLTDSFSQQLTRGGGLGLSGMIEKQMTPRTALHAAPAAASPAAPAAASAPSGIPATPQTSHAAS